MHTTKRWTRLVSAALAGLFVALPAPPLRSQDDKPNLTIILDSSRSMWGQIDGINKVVSVRTVIGELAKKSAGKLNLGLVSYGHRRSGDCRDIEVLLPPGSYKPAKVAKTVNAVKPTGSTPIAASLETAANVAEFKKRKTDLLLISDGLDNCSGNPCAVAGKLKSQSASLSIHVIAFDRKKQASLKKLSCIAEKTGGSFASTASEKALAAAATQVVSRILAPAPPPVAQAQEPAPSPAVPETPRLSTPQAATPLPQAPPAEQKAAPQQMTAAKSKPETARAPAKPAPVTLSARLVEGGEKLQNGIVWRIFEPKPDKSGKYKLVGTYRNPEPTDALVPGEYLVNAAYGLAHLTKKIQVQAGQSLQEDFVLNAGGLRLGAVLTNGAAIPPNSVRYDIFAGEADQFGNRKKILADAKPGLILRLNAGAYHVVSVYGDANAVVRTDIAVEPGRLTEATVNHAAAKVTFKLVLQPGGEALADTQWSLLTPGGDVVKESAGALPTHVLAAGTYSVLARHDGKNYSRDFEVATGDVKQIEVVVR